MTPRPKRHARCGRCNTELLLHKASGILACVACDLVGHWPTNQPVVKAEHWRPALNEDRTP